MCVFFLLLFFFFVGTHFRFSPGKNGAARGRRCHGRTADDARLSSAGSDGSPACLFPCPSVRNILASSETAVHRSSLDYKLRGSFSIDEGTAKGVGTRVASTEGAQKHGNRSSLGARTKAKQSSE